MLYRARREADEAYRAALRDKLHKKLIQQVDVVKALGITRETVRRDAMTDEERDRIRKADADRRRQGRAAGKRTPTDG